MRAEWTGQRTIADAGVRHMMMQLAIIMSNNNQETAATDANKSVCILTIHSYMHNPIPICLRASSRPVSHSLRGYRLNTCLCPICNVEFEKISSINRGNFGRYLSFV